MGIAFHEENSKGNSQFRDCHRDAIELLLNMHEHHHRFTLVLLGELKKYRDYENRGRGKLLSEQQKLIPYLEKSIPPKTSIVRILLIGIVMPIFVTICNLF
jgi:hypothetical protein